MAPRAAAESEATDGESDSTPIVDFQAQIQPIFMRHCYECHGAGMAEGGLRLDNRQKALEGGDSGKPIFGRPLASNELYRRVTTTDESERMPLGKKQLSATAIALIGKWIEQLPEQPASNEGPADPVPSAVKPPQQRSGQAIAETSRIADGNPSWMQIAFDRLITPTTLPKLFFMAAAVTMVIAGFEAAKSWYRSGRAWTRGRAAPFFRRVERIRGWHSLTAVTAAALIGFLAFSVISVEDYYQSRLDSKSRELGADKRDLASRVTYLENVARRQGLNIDSNPGRSLRIADVYGSPPIPLRPNHSRRLRGSYYRGNCERDHKLFNYGNYLTATFHIGLCDGTGDFLELNDAVPADGLLIRFELVRAPLTADALYSRVIMESVALSQTYSKAKQKSGPDAVSLEVLEPDQRWIADFPIDTSKLPPTGEATLAGLIYVYKGATAHYGLKYDVIIADGRIADGSEVWMGSLFRSGRVALPQPGKIPLAEWFDDRPMPTIVGENTTDPELLGIPKHLPAATPESLDGDQPPTASSVGDDRKGSR